jgi:hypothetical protein
LTATALVAPMVAALALPDTIEGLGRMGMESTSSTPAELAAALKADNERWARWSERQASAPPTELLARGGSRR